MNGIFARAHDYFRRKIAYGVMVQVLGMLQFYLFPMIYRPPKRTKAEHSAYDEDRQTRKRGDPNVTDFYDCLQVREDAQDKLEPFVLSFVENPAAFVMSEDQKVCLCPCATLRTDNTFIPQDKR